MLYLHQRRRRGGGGRRRREEEEEEEEAERQVAAEMTSSMRVNRPRWARSNTTISPIRPSLVGALEFRSTFVPPESEKHASGSATLQSVFRATHLRYLRPGRISTRLFLVIPILLVRWRQLPSRLCEIEPSPLGMYPGTWIP